MENTFGILETLPASALGANEEQPQPRTPPPGFRTIEDLFGDEYEGPEESSIQETSDTSSTGVFQTPPRPTVPFNAPPPRRNHSNPEMRASRVYDETVNDFVRNDVEAAKRKIAAAYSIEATDADKNRFIEALTELSAESKYLDNIAEILFNIESICETSNYSTLSVPPQISSFPPASSSPLSSAPPSRIALEMMQSSVAIMKLIKGIRALSNGVDSDTRTFNAIHGNAVIHVVIDRFNMKVSAQSHLNTFREVCEEMTTLYMFPRVIDGIVSIPIHMDHVPPLAYYEEMSNCFRDAVNIQATVETIDSDM